MKLIFAQGNPGAEYAKTRHNVGFLALDHYADTHSLEFQSKMKFNADIAEMIVSDEKVLFVKPMTFYNETGRSGRALIDFYKATRRDVLVLHDELALPFGTVRTRDKGSDAGNNGIKSLNAHLGQEYARVRIGIRNSLTDNMDAADFVLSSFTTEERAALDSTLFPKVAEIIDQFITDAMQFTTHS